MADIKSAREIARQKIDSIGEPTEDDRLRWKYIPEGKTLAVECLKKKVDIKKSLSGYEKKAAGYVKKGMESVLLANINLPQSEMVKNKNGLIIDYIRHIKNDREAVEEILSGLGQIFEHYNEQGEQQRKQVYDNLKIEYAQKLRQAVEKQLGTADGVDMDVEKLPQFQEEWRQAQAQLDSQYINLMDECKKQLKSID